MKMGVYGLHMQTISSSHQAAFAGAGAAPGGGLLGAAAALAGGPV